MWHLASKVNKRFFHGNVSRARRPLSETLSILYSCYLTSSNFSPATNITSGAENNIVKLKLVYLGATRMFELYQSMWITELLQGQNMTLDLSCTCCLLEDTIRGFPGQGMNKRECSLTLPCGEDITCTQWSLVAPAPEDEFEGSVIFQQMDSGCIPPRQGLPS